MTPATIKKTRLYRTLAPKIRKQDREEFARMLAMVPVKALPRWNTTSVFSAFTWGLTPQGGEYWRELHNRLVRHELGPDNEPFKDY